MRKSVATERKKEKAVRRDGKYRDKTMDDFSKECLYHILKKLSGEDNLHYFTISNDDGSGNRTEVHQCTFIGTEERFVVDGRASIGCFTPNGSHYLGPDGKSGVEVTYHCEAHTQRDRYGQPEVVVGAFDIDGIDELMIDPKA